MKRQIQESEVIWSALLQIAKSRSRFFSKHGERFDRRLYAEVESIIRISLELHAKAAIDVDPARFKELRQIQRDLLRLGQDEYLDFP